jgi:hypothetical protein
VARGEVTLPDGTALLPRAAPGPTPSWRPLPGKPRSELPQGCRRTSTTRSSHC